MSITTADRCPACASPLTTPDDAEPWCDACEWNLDAFPPVEGVGWVWRRIYRWDAQAGFRADRHLVRTWTADASGSRRGFGLLVAVSAGLVLLMLAAAAAGGWTIATAWGLPPVLLGLLLLVLAWMLRPRLGRLRRLVRHRYRLPATHAPALHALIEEIAAKTGAPVPDLLTIDFAWNASASVVGLRRTRVLTLGVPLLLTLRPQHLVALIGHELGHFAHDTRRDLLTCPALTVLGSMSAALRPPPGNALDRGLEGFFALAYMLFQAVTGSVSLALYYGHLALHVVASRDGRRAELRADAMAARAAGSRAAVEMLDTLALLPELQEYVQPSVREDDPGGHWRRILASVRERELHRVPVLRRQSIRTDASLLATHPAPGRRHEWLSRQPAVAAAVTLDDTRAAAIERELRPYARELRRRLAGRELI